MSSSLKVLAVRFHPVQPQRMQKRRQALHKKENNTRPSAPHPPAPVTARHGIFQNRSSLKPRRRRQPDPTNIMHRLTSMMHRINTVSTNHIPVTTRSTTHPNIDLGPRKFSIVIPHSTSDSWACASDNAQSRRYEAVCEIHPRQNSMV